MIQYLQITDELGINLGAFTSWEVVDIDVEGGKPGEVETVLEMTTILGGLQHFRDEQAQQITQRLRLLGLSTEAAARSLTESANILEQQAKGAKP